MSAVYTSVTICLFGALTMLNLYITMGAIQKLSGGFYNIKKRCYYAPINSKKLGAEIDIGKTTPYTAMQIVKPMRPTIGNFYE